MFKIADKLYIAKCRECRTMQKNGYTLVYSCHWPCTLAQRQAGQEPCREEREASAPNPDRQLGVFLDVPNLEIPNYRPEDFKRYLDLIDQNLRQREVVLVSENGESRAPSLALLWMAFRGKMISASSFPAARADFTALYPQYIPWPGWVIFFEQEWDMFR